MLNVELAEKPYAQQAYHRALPSGGSGVGQLAFYAGRHNGAPSLVLCGGLRGRCLDEARTPLGEGVARTLASRHAAQRLPALDDWVALLGGGFLTGPIGAERGAVCNVRPVWMAFRASVARVVGVAGPHDAWPAPAAAPFLDGQIEVINGLRIAGVSGIVDGAPKFRGRPLVQFAALLEELMKFAPHIVLIHESPLAGVGGEGCEALSEVFLRAEFSGLVVSSRTEWAHPMVVRGQTTFLNVHGRVVSLVGDD